MILPEIYAALGKTLFVGSDYKVYPHIAWVKSQIEWDVFNLNSGFPLR